MASNLSQMYEQSLSDIRSQGWNGSAEYLQSQAAEVFSLDNKDHSCDPEILGRLTYLVAALVVKIEESDPSYGLVPKEGE